MRQLIFPTAWYPNQLPLLDAIQFQQAFSLGANVTLLAANIRNDKLMTTGSGIFTPFFSTYHHAKKDDPEEGRLLVARVPVLDPRWVGQSEATEDRLFRDESTPAKATESGYCHQESLFDSSCSEPAPGFSPSSSVFVSSMMYDSFTFVLLTNQKHTVTVCDGSFCCQLQYRLLPQENSKELYALGAFSGTHTKNGRYALQVGVWLFQSGKHTSHLSRLSLQVCAVVRCAALDASSCGQEVEEAESKMDFVLEGKFETRYVYPSILVSHMVLEQPEHLEKTADGRVTMKHSNMTGGLVTACLYGRMYHLDKTTG